MSILRKVSSWLRLPSSSSSINGDPSPSGTVSRKSSRTSIRTSLMATEPSAAAVNSHKHSASQSTNGTASDVSPRTSGLSVPVHDKPSTDSPATNGLIHERSSSQATNVNKSDSSHTYRLPVPIIQLPSGDPDSSDPDSNGPVRSRSRASSIAPPPTPENEQRALVSLGVQCTLSLVQVVAEIMPVPCIGKLAECLTKVFEAVEQSKVNKEQWKLLQGRCVMVARIAATQVTNYGQHHYPGLEDATQMTKQTLDKVVARVRQYNGMHEIRAFLLFKAISEEIKGHFAELDSCLTLFSYATDVAQAQWTSEFRKVQQKELADLQRIYDIVSKVDTRLERVDNGLNGVNNGLNGVNDKLDDIHHDQAKIAEIMELLHQELVNKSNVLQDQGTTTVTSYVDAQNVVRTILAVTDLKLPPKLLVGQQCVLDTNVPIKTGITCDVYTASYLGGEKVAKKVFRIGMSDRDYVQKYAERFIRIATLWCEFRSHNTLPFYGIGMESIEGDKHFQLYMVSPLMKNFDAVSYLNEYRNNAGMKQGILRIITDAAKGLKYLHKLDPPVVHSGMRGDNILITDSGGGILGGFGLTKALEIEGEDKMPHAVMTGKTESQRWMAPELLSEDRPVLQTPSDVWGWAMAALEIVSGSIPYHSHTQAHSVMLKVLKGSPKRTDHPKWEDYAYRPDEMWELLEWCWTTDPNKRPTMQQVVAKLKDIAAMSEHVKQASDIQEETKK